jgi:hypothetical protein
MCLQNSSFISMLNTYIPLTLYPRRAFLMLAPAKKNFICEFIVKREHDEKHIVPTPFSEIRVGKRSCFSNVSKKRFFHPVSLKFTAATAK